jgi:hypothetical protein
MTSPPPSIQFLLQETCSGHADFKKEILERIRSFPKIVLRGAGALGHDIYRILYESVGVDRKNMVYWDIQEKAHINGLPVYSLFEGGFNPETTLVIHCIGKALHYDSQFYLLQGYKNSLDGNFIFALYNKLPCPYYKGIGQDMKLCQPNTRCAFFACEKAPVTWRNVDIDFLEDRNALLFNSLCVDVNTFCTLKCRHCCQYMNHYSAEERGNFPLERIKQDINLMCDSSDFIREIYLQGGEFFLHPNSAEIIDFTLQKSTIGIVSVISNCICKIETSDISAMRHERFVLRISDYSNQLNKKQKELFEKNILKFDTNGIPYQITRNEWIMPPDMQNLNHCEKRKIEQHSNCYSKESKRGRLVHNGVYYPCQRAKELSVHHIVDYPDNYLILDSVPSPTERKRIILSLNEREFYPSCAHCDWTLPIVPAGKQGFEPLYQHLGHPHLQN